MNPNSQIDVRVDLSNPGQYFACCGLLELGQRLWPGADAWFAGGVFHMRGGCAADLMKALRECGVANTMTEAQRRRRAALSEMGQKALKADPRLEEEKKELDSLWRELPVVFGEPFHLRIDWFLDDRSGGKSFKTWAGQQSIVDIVTDLQGLMPEPGAAPANWLDTAAATECVPLNFDSMLGGAGADVDVGFSFDPLKSAGLRVAIRPAVELLAFAGLQRFRPAECAKTWEYGVWSRPAGAELGALLASVPVPGLVWKRFRFQLLYRTKYLKSFLPARAV